MAEITQKENIMGTQKMSKLILFTGIPLMIGLFINSLYNFVDIGFGMACGNTGGFTLGFCRNIQQVGES